MSGPYIAWILPGIGFLLLVYLTIDFRGPGYIPLRRGKAFGMDCLRAGELIVQESDAEGNLWASRGMLLYCLKKGEVSFQRVARVPTGLSYYWLNNFSLFRRIINKPECLEATVSGSGQLIALSAGFMWHRSAGRRKFKRVFELPHYGLGVGRGILTNGLLSAGGDRIYFGEYFRNTERGSVKIFGSSDGGRGWEAISEYSPKTIRHIHAIQQDPYSGRLWVCSGDKDPESMIGWSEDGLRNITHIGSGSQVWRTCQLVFTADAVYWGTDTGSVELAGVYRWDRETGEVRRVHSSKGAMLYGTRLPGGTLVFTTDREGFPNEADLLTRLITVDVNGRVSEIECGTWKHRKRGLRYSFAMLRLQRNQESGPLALSVINQREFSGGELILIEEPELLRQSGLPEQGMDTGE